MLNNKISFIKGVSFHSMLMTIFIAFCIGGSILLGFGKIPLALYMFVAICIYLKKAENVFLFWLLTFPLFSTDSTAILTIGIHPIITYDRVFIVVLLFLFSTEIILRKKKLLPINSLEITLIFFLLAMTFSIITKTENKLFGARVLIDIFLLPFIIYFLSKNFISDKKSFNKFINVILTVGIYLSIMGFYEHFIKRDIFVSKYGGIFTPGDWLRVNGPFIRDTTFGVFIGICFFIVLYKYAVSDKRSKFKNIYYAIVLGMTLVAMFLCLYRGIWLAWALGMLTWFLIRRKGLIKLNFVIITLVMIIIPFININKIQSTRFYQERITNVANIQHRLERYDYSFSLFKKNPIFGIGFRNYSPLTGTTIEQHNQILAMLSETGILGTSIFMIIIYLLLYYGVKSYKLSNNYSEKQFSIIYLSILIVYLVPGLSLNTGFDRWINLLFFAVAGVAFNRTRKE